MSNSFDFLDSASRRESHRALRVVAPQLRMLSTRHKVPAMVRSLCETKHLAEGTTIGNSQLPESYIPDVIEEAYADLNVLDLINIKLDPSASTSVGIPYEKRNQATIPRDGIVFEGEGIPLANISQEMDTAYVFKRAISLSITDEVFQFGKPSNLLNWDAYARNVKSNSRMISELTARHIANELQRSSDCYSAAQVLNESVAVQLTGTGSLIKTAYFPIVRPFQVIDIRGNAVYPAECPISMILDGVTLSQYNGTGSQTAGTYWKVENYNLGLIRLVDQTGAIVTPTATTAILNYWRATNCSYFDLKLAAGVDIADHLNGALRQIGAQKAAMNADRFILPDFCLMSPILNDMITNASQFVASQKRQGDSLTLTGDLETIKALPAYSTNIGCDLGDERILMGERGALTHVLVDPLRISDLFNAVASDGRTPIGTKLGYCWTYAAIHVPTALRNCMTSVIVYDSDARAAAA